MNIGEKVAYLKGIAEGIKVGEKSEEGKILIKIIDILTEISYELEDLQNAQDVLEDFVDELDEDLGEIEEEVFDMDDNEDDEDILEIECPNCEAVIEFEVDEISDDGKITCPECDEEIEILCDCSCCQENT